MTDLRFLIFVVLVLILLFLVSKAVLAAKSMALMLSIMVSAGRICLVLAC